MVRRWSFAFGIPKLQGRTVKRWWSNRTEPSKTKLCSSNWIISPSRGENIKKKQIETTTQPSIIWCFCTKVTRQRITTLVKFQGSWGCTAASWGDILGPTARSSICDWRSFSCLKARMCLDGWVDRLWFILWRFLGWEWSLFNFLWFTWVLSTWWWGVSLKMRGAALADLLFDLDLPLQEARLRKGWHARHLFGLSNPDLLPSRKLTYPTWGKGKSSSKWTFQGKG